MAHDHEIVFPNMDEADAESEDQISDHVRELAHNLFQQLESWVKTGSLTNNMLQPAVELLQQVFLDLNKYYMLVPQMDSLREENDHYEQLLRAMKMKYMSSVQQHNACVDELEQQVQEKENEVRKLRETNADLSSRLTSTKSALEECQNEYSALVNEKQLEDSRKLNEVVESYCSYKHISQGSLLGRLASNREEDLHFTMELEVGGESLNSNLSHLGNEGSLKQDYVQGTDTHHVTEKEMMPQALPLAQELEQMSSDAFLQTAAEMQRILTQRDEVLNENEKLKSLKQELSTELDASRSQNVELKRIIEELKSKEENLMKKLVSVRHDYEKALQESLSDQTLSHQYVITRKEFHDKLVELTNLKTKYYFLEEEYNNFKRHIRENISKPIFSTFRNKTKMFRTNTSTAHTAEQQNSKKSVGVISTSSRPIPGISLDTYTPMDNWLVGNMKFALPGYIGQILLEGLAIRRIDGCAVSRICSSPFLSESSAAALSSLSNASISSPLKTSNFNWLGHCLAEVWIATSCGSTSDLEIVSLMEKEVKKKFMTSYQRIHCMLAVHGGVPVSQKFPKNISHETDEEFTNMWVVSAQEQLRNSKDVGYLNGLHFFSINGEDCHRELNSINILKRSFCIEYSNNRVFIGQADATLMVFCKSAENKMLWNIKYPITRSHLLGLKRSICCIKGIGNKLWIAIKKAICIVDPISLNGQIVDENNDDEQEASVNCIVEVKSFAVVSFYEKPAVRIYDSGSGSFIKKIDITSICIILDELPTSPNKDSKITKVTAIASDCGTLYVGTSCGKIIAFTAKTLSNHTEDRPDSITNDASQQEDVRAKLERQLVNDSNSCAISVHMHKFSLKKMLCVTLPAPLQPDSAVAYNSLIVTVGKGYHRINAESSAHSTSQIDGVQDDYQLLIWGNRKEDRDT